MVVGVLVVLRVHAYVPIQYGQHGRLLRVDLRCAEGVYAAALQSILAKKTNQNTTYVRAMT